MSQRSHTTWVGLFVLGAMFLGIGTVLYVGSLKLFSKDLIYLMYFNESVNGLSVGAPVKFRGVPIGQVQDVRIRYNQDAMSTAIPVFIEVDERRVRDLLGDRMEMEDARYLQEQVADGLRGRLQISSFISGQLFVELDYFEDGKASPVRYYQVGNEYLEIPTEPSPLAQLGATTSDLAARISSIDFVGIIEDFRQTIISIRTAVDGLDLAGVAGRLESAALTFETAMTDAQIGVTMEEFRWTLEGIERLSVQLENEFSGVGSGVKMTMNEMNVAIRRVDRMGKQIESMLLPGGAMRVEFDKLLRDLGDASQSVQRLTSFLERNPEALIGGRKRGETDK